MDLEKEAEEAYKVISASPAMDPDQASVVQSREFLEILLGMIQTEIEALGD